MTAPSFIVARGVECPFCHRTVTVYDKQHAATVKIVGCGCVDCLCELSEDGWTYTLNPDCPIHGKEN